MKTARTLLQVRWDFLPRDGFKEAVALQQQASEVPWDDAGIKGFFRNNPGRNATIRRAFLEKPFAGLQEGTLVGLCAFFSRPGVSRQWVVADILVHPAVRGQQLGRWMLDRLRMPSGDASARILLGLVPEQDDSTRRFFKHCDVPVRPTLTKGVLVPYPVVSAMSFQDADDAQSIENAVFAGTRHTPRRLKEKLENGVCSGLVARDQYDNSVLGYALYQRTDHGIDLDGEFGVIVNLDWRRLGVGRGLMEELRKLGQPITFVDINVRCREQCAFLAACCGIKVSTRVTLPWAQTHQS